LLVASIFQVTILLTTSWSPIVQADFQSDDACKPQLEATVSIYQQAVMRLTVFHLKNGKIEFAYNEFKELEMDDLFVKEFIKSTYSNETLTLLQLASLICRSYLFTSVYTATNTLYEEMANKKQLLNRQIIIPLYYKIESLIDDVNFHLQAPEFRTKFLKLNNQLSQQKVQIVKLFADEILVRKYDSHEYTLTVMESLSLLDAALFQADVMNVYLASNLTNYSQLFKFITTLTSYTMICNFYATIWQTLRTKNSSESMEALAIWIHASEITQMRNISDTLCTPISNRKVPPEYKSAFVSEYKNYILKKDYSKINDLHKKYRLNYFVMDFINNLELSELLNEKYVKLITYLVSNPIKRGDGCYAAAAAHTKFEAFGKLGSYENFQILKSTREFVHGSSLDKISRPYCKSARENLPAIFLKLLSEKTSNCSVRNRFYAEETLLCANFNSTEDGYRTIYTTPLQFADASQFWNMQFSKVNKGIYFKNKYHNNITLRYIKDNVRGSDKALDKEFDYFRIHAVDEDYIMLEPADGEFGKAFQNFW
jgi:hypothetical protein